MTSSGAQALLHSSHIYHGAKSDYSNYGVMVDNVQIDIKKMMAQKDKAVTGLTKGVEGLFKKNKVSGGSMQSGSHGAGVVMSCLRQVHEFTGLRHQVMSSICTHCNLALQDGIWPHAQVSYVKGYGKLAPDGKVEVKQDDDSTVTLSGKSTIIATGSAVASLPGLEIDEDR